MKVNKNGVISSINQTAETIKIQASKINLEGYVTVTDLKVDGNIKFGGQLQGASGSFEGDLTSDFVTIGSSNPSYAGFSRSGLAVKMPERISTGNYTWNGEFVLGLGNGVINFGLEDSGFSPTYSFDGPITTHQGLVETIVSKGSNSKGHWIKYSSGKMEVWCTPIATTCTNTSGNVYRSDVFDVDFPQSFDDSHPISVALNVTAVGRWADIVNIPSSTGCRAHQYSTVYSTGNYSAFVYAVGMALVGVG